MQCYTAFLEKSHRLANYVYNYKVRIISTTSHYGRHLYYAIFRNTTVICNRNYVDKCWCMLLFCRMLHYYYLTAIMMSARSIHTSHHADRIYNSVYIRQLSRRLYARRDGVYVPAAMSCAWSVPCLTPYYTMRTIQSSGYRSIIVSHTQWHRIIQWGCNSTVSYVHCIRKLSPLFFLLLCPPSFAKGIQVIRINYCRLVRTCVYTRDTTACRGVWPQICYW